MEDKWIPIFKAGKQTDSQGREHDGADLIAKAIATFDAKQHEPPVVIGHPKDNAPAFAWIKGLKKSGEFLLAQIHQVQPDFEDMLRQGLFKKRSAAFNDDGSLRHVGYLGAAAPAVKGLPDFAFAAGESTVFEFGQHESHKWGTLGRILRNLREVLLTKHDEETADKVVDNFDIDFLTEPEEPPPSPSAQDPAFQKPTEEKVMPKQFTEEEIAKIKSDAAKEATEKAEADFAEKEKGKPTQTQFEQMQADLKKQKEVTHKKDINSFCDKLTEKGKYLPAFDAMGMRTFMQGLDHEAPVEFSKDKKLTPLEFMESFLEALPNTVNFEEISKEAEGDPTPKSKDDHLADTSKFDQAKMEQHTKALAFSKENKCTYEEALDQV